jgi:hypothetical protein
MEVVFETFGTEDGCDCFGLTSCSATSSPDKARDKPWPVAVGESGIGRSRGQQWLSSRSASLQRISPRIKHAYGTSFFASTDIYKPLPAQHEVAAESPSTVEDWLKAWLDRGTSRAGLAVKKLSARSARKRS